MTSLIPPTPAPSTSSFIFETPVAVSCLKRRSSDRLVPPLLKRKRDHAYCAPVAFAAVTFNDNLTPFNRGNSLTMSSLPVLDISDFHPAMPLPGQDVEDADLPKISLRPRTRMFEAQDVMEPQVLQAPRLTFSLVPASPAHQPQEDDDTPVEEEESYPSESGAAGSTTLKSANQISRRSSFSSTTAGTPLLKRSLSLQFNLRRLSIGSCNSLNTMAGCTNVLTTSAGPSDCRSSCQHLNKGLDKLSIPSLEDEDNWILGKGYSDNKSQLPLAVAQPPQAKRGSRMVFDYLATALRLPDVALGV
jgi:hypothetical protein